MQGQTVVCIGSGPSLTLADCELVRRSGLPVIAINNAWEFAPFADVIFGGDGPWWDYNIQGITIPAERWTSSDEAHHKYGLNFFRPPQREWHGGLRAVQLAEHKGASKVILLGYDCSVKHGVHCHGLHKNTSNPTATVCGSWRWQFQRLAATIKIPVINCTRVTALEAFPLANLEDELCLKLSQDEMRPKMNSSSVAS